MNHRNNALAKANCLVTSKLNMKNWLNWKSRAKLTNELTRCVTRTTAMKGIYQTFDRSETWHFDRDKFDNCLRCKTSHFESRMKSKKFRKNICRLISNENVTVNVLKWEKRFHSILIYWLVQRYRIHLISSWFIKENFPQFFRKTRSN